ncbi:MAG: PHB depolymerase family esterase [Ideonella sp.]
MKSPFQIGNRSIDAQAINDTIARALASAGLDTSTGPMHSVTETIRQALGSVGMVDPTAPTTASPRPIIDIEARVIDAGDATHAAPVDRPVDRPAARSEPAGRFTSHRFSGAAGARSYKLYTPAGSSAAPRPVVVMLHGCTQTVDDFARGTRMNQLADLHDVLVVYPEQATQANPSKCWNWFNTQDQLRDSGEPSLIAGIVREVITSQRADPRRVFVAGLSAGAAMSVILGETYPEMFAGVGAHSGLPYGSAHDMPSALAAMKAGRSGIARSKGLPAMPGSQLKQTSQPMPTIVFHGDRDHTVQQENGNAIVEQAQRAYQAQAGHEPLRRISHQGTAPGGRGFERTQLVDGSGLAQVEQWVLRGAGHAWAGGDSGGSYTDATGPDASAEMLKFFLARQRAGSA